MYKLLSKDTIELEIVHSIPVVKRCFKSKVLIWEIINCILYKLKTCIQWYLLPIFQLFRKEILHHKTIFGYYRKCKAGIWKSCWNLILQKNKSKIDVSSTDVDGSHSPPLRSGEVVSYQGRKKRKTTNAIYLTDRNGLPLAMSITVCGNFNKQLFKYSLKYE